jgi:hypothetical protein
MTALRVGAAFGVLTFGAMYCAFVAFGFGFGFGFGFTAFVAAGFTDSAVVAGEADGLADGVDAALCVGAC